MKTLLTVGLVGLLGLQAFGVDALLLKADCEEGCPSDGPDGSCAPFCPDCVCCPTLRSFVQPEAAALPPSRATRTIPPELRRSIPSLRASDIFHVPRPSLA